MKVLLCAPYNTGPEYVQGGITIWAHNIMDYYRTVNSSVDVEVQSVDRKKRGEKDSLEANANFVSRTVNGLNDYRKVIRQIRIRLGETRYDLIHLCSSASISLFKDLMVVKMARKRGVKTVVHFHFGRIPELARQQNWEWKLLYCVVRLADEVITMDQKSYRTLINNGFNNVHYLPNPLSQAIIQQIQQESKTVSREAKKLCFVGHVIPTKGVFEMVEACKNIKGIKLNVVGKVDDGVRKKMESIAGDAFSFSLNFIGEVDHQSVIRELLSTDVFVLPSYTEGFPNVILESMACGCAIATTTVGAIPEMLDIDGNTPCGLCCEPKDTNGLRENIQFFLNNPEKARELGERAAIRVNELYAVPKVWEQLEKIWSRNN